VNPGHPSLQPRDCPSEPRECRDGSPLRLADRMHESLLTEGSAEHALEEHGFRNGTERSTVCSLKEPHRFWCLQEVFESPAARRVVHD